MSDQPEDLEERQLRNADLQGANLVGADLSGMDIRGADLSNASLEDSNLRNADLSQADLTSASLVDADLSGANLTETTLTDATLTGANLADTKGATVSTTGSSTENELDELAELGNGSQLTEVVSTVVIGATLIGAFGLMAFGWSYFWIVFIIGFAGVLPIATQLTSWYESRADEAGEASSDDDTEKQMAALDRLRERYASGEIDEAEFEQRVERLLETESLDSAEALCSSMEASQPDQESEEHRRERETERA